MLSDPICFSNTIAIPLRPTIVPLFPLHEKIERKKKKKKKHPLTDDYEFGIDLYQT
jgi:hypothetical protein